MVATPRDSLLPVHVQPDLLIPLGDGHVALGGGDDDRLAGGRRAELLGQVYLDGQDVAFDLHVHVLHGNSPVKVHCCAANTLHRLGTIPIVPLPPAMTTK